MLRWSYTRGPDLRELKLGYACNNRCRHCAVDGVGSALRASGERTELTTAEIIDLLDDAARANVGAVVLTGGEVSLRRDLEAVVRHGADLGLALILHSNGRRFSSRALASRIASAPGLSFLVSLHAAHARAHDEITGVPGSFDEACRGIRNLRALTPDVAVKLVLLRDNRGEAAATVRLASDLGASELCVAFPFAGPHQIAVVPRYRDVADELRATQAAATAVGLPLTFETIPYCVISDLPEAWPQNADLWRAGRVGTLRSCAAANAADADWDLLRPALKAKHRGCAVCVFDRLCEGPWREYVGRYGFEEFAPVPAARVAPLVEALDTSRRRTRPARGDGGTRTRKDERNAED